MFSSFGVAVKDRIKMVFAAASLVVGACSADNVHLQSSYNRSTYDFLNFTTYQAGRDTKVVIHGNPFAMNTEVFNKAVTDNMQGANFGQRTNFTTTPGKSAEPNIWVVMAFNANIGIYEICNYKPIKTRPASIQLRLSAAWCFDGRQDSLVEATVGQVEDINDPRFRALIQQVVLNLFPRNKFRDDSDDRDRRRR